MSIRDKPKHSERAILRNDIISNDDDVEDMEVAQSNHDAILNKFTKRGLVHRHVDLDSGDCGPPNDRPRVFYLVCNVERYKEMKAAEGAVNQPDETIRREIASHLDDVVCCVEFLKDKLVPYDFEAFVNDLSDSEEEDAPAAKKPRLGKWVEETKVVFGNYGLQFDPYYIDKNYDGNVHYARLSLREKAIVHLIDKIKPMPTSGAEQIMDLYLGCCQCAVFLVSLDHSACKLDMVYFQFVRIAELALQVRLLAIRCTSSMLCLLAVGDSICGRFAFQLS